MIIGLVGGAVLTQLQEVSYFLFVSNPPCCRKPPCLWNPPYFRKISLVGGVIYPYEDEPSLNLSLIYFPILWSACLYTMIIIMLSQAHALKVAERHRDQQEREEQLLRQHLLAKSKQLGTKQVPPPPPLYTTPPQHNYYVNIFSPNRNN